MKDRKEVWQNKIIWEIKKYLILIIPILILLFFITIYLIKFHNGLSSDSEDWSDFGSYIGGVSTLIFSSAAIYVSYKVSIHNYNREMTDRYFYMIIQQMEELKKWIDALQLLTSRTKYEIIDSAIEESKPGYTQQKENEIITYLKNCNSYIAKITMGVELCLNRYGFQYADKDKLLNVLNNDIDTLDKVKKTYELVERLISEYKKTINN